MGALARFLKYPLLVLSVVFALRFWEVVHANGEVSVVLGAETLCDVHLERLEL